MGKDPLANIITSIRNANIDLKKKMFTQHPLISLKTLLKYFNETVLLETLESIKKIKDFLGINPMLQTSKRVYRTIIKNINQPSV